ncbi:unnamed protein product (macronuclear) [Paramecium tetraurelia]|uniref:Uncharacterized protein n=1 Tax=Paramecium tetraurelia TaxID=5888 RepID=A0CVU1_PARTE|nr:uncharacterized protein GSPATT00001110001 [Paramecium tetraurelia]CAK74908.1 unnamed protein product [Paramecium tetraurelia]|eukprot:XP_001442305.1 hypothetical protein (macronuclear) [Paramecium tetraurelia strain d4-2]
MQLWLPSSFVKHQSRILIIQANLFTFEVAQFHFNHFVQNFTLKFNYLDFKKLVINGLPCYGILNEEFRTYSNLSISSPLSQDIILAGNRFSDTISAKKILSNEKAANSDPKQSKKIVNILKSCENPISLQFQKNASRTLQ